MKSAFAKGFPFFGMQCDEVAKRIKKNISKGVTWLEANMRVNKMELKTKKVPLMIIFLSNDVDDDG